MTIIARQARPRPTTRFLTFSPGAAWAKLAGNTSLEHVALSNFPNNFWGQVDVWIPPQTFTACGDGVLGSETAEFLDFGNDSLHARLIGGAWKWETNYGTVAATGPAAATKYTIKFHYVYSGGSFASVDWYVNAVLVATDSSVNHFASTSLFLNRQPGGCCCEIYYYTGAQVGTSDGGSEIFADNFSGGLGNWARNSPILMPSGLTLVAAPVAAACPTLALSPPRGLPGTSLTVTGTGFAPSRPLQLFFGTHDVGITESSDGSGNASFTATVPHIPSTGTGDGYDVFLLDDEANVACSNDFSGGGFKVCGVEPADGITTAPDPVVATGGLTNNNNEILDYIFHDGAHWVLWQDESVTTGLTTFPPPANHTMNATRISADGSTVTDYPIDTGYQWIFGAGAVDDPGLSADDVRCPFGFQRRPVWSSKFFFQSWAKPIYDARFASDGANLWVGVVTRETIRYPWLDNNDKVITASGIVNPGALKQFAPLVDLTSGFTVFDTSATAFTGYLRFNTQTDGAVNIYRPSAIPVTDAGEKDSGHWSPPCAVIFGFDGGGFNRLGAIPAAYCPGITGGQKYSHLGILGVPIVAQPAPRGSLFSRISMAASPNNPGVCHVVWSEGGDWGRQGDGVLCLSTLDVWDGGPPTRSYRVNYTTWDTVGVLTNTDVFESHFDRSTWSFPDEGNDTPVGYSWPDQANFAGLLNHDLRNDNAAGTPYLFAVWPQSFQNPFKIPNDALGAPWLDNDIVWGDTLHVYDLSSGGAVEVQTLDLSTLGMTEAEITSIWTVSDPPFAPPYGPVDAVMLPTGAPTDSSYAAQPKGFGISLPYNDPELGVPVYLVHLPLIKRFLNQVTSPLPTAGNYPARGFYRVPCDMSTGFDYLDGNRSIGFTILKEPNGLAAAFGSNDFFSDPKNIWVPESDGFNTGFFGFPGFWFDRVCLNQWEPFSVAWTPPVVDYWLGSQCPGFHYETASDSITTVTAASISEPSPGPLFAVTTQFLCRGCRNCECGTGVHIAHRF